MEPAMTPPPCDTTEGVLWLAIVALVAMLTGFVIGATSDARHGRTQVPLAALLEAKSP